MRPLRGSARIACASTSLTRPSRSSTGASTSSPSSRRSTTCHGPSRSSRPLDACSHPAAPCSWSTRTSQEVFTAPGDEIERTMYAYSVLFCLPESRVDPTSVATGTVMRPATLGAVRRAGRVLAGHRPADRARSLPALPAGSVTLRHQPSGRSGAPASDAGPRRSSRAGSPRRSRGATKATGSPSSTSGAAWRSSRSRTRRSSPSPIAASSSSSASGSPTPIPITAWSARSSASRRAVLRHAGTSTRSTAPTTTSAACRSSRRSSRSSATASSRRGSSPHPRSASAGGAGAAAAHGSAAASARPDRTASPSLGSASSRRPRSCSRARRSSQASGLTPGFGRLLASSWRERAFGDFWGYTLVSEGAAEVMVEPDLSPWDAAAPFLLVEEAGGRVTDFAGDRSIANRTFLATNGMLHDEVRSVLLGREENPP